MGLRWASSRWGRIIHINRMLSTSRKGKEAQSRERKIDGLGSRRRGQGRHPKLRWKD